MEDLEDNILEEVSFFARLDEDKKVIQVIFVPNDEALKNKNFPESEALGQEYIKTTIGLPGEWIQTSYTGEFRKRYGLPNYQYDEDLDIFIPPQPYPSWIYDEEEYTWNPPIEKPDDGKVYIWNEDYLIWEEDYEVE
jgi:hypothetical protein